MRYSLLHLLLLASMVAVSLSILSVAPDDFANECGEFAQPGSFSNRNEKVLLDTQFYPSTSLLSVQGEDGLWISIDVDMLTGTGTDKVRKHESQQKANKESVCTCECVRCILYTFVAVD